jgi:hypothetical protein
MVTYGGGGAVARVGNTARVVGPYIGAAVRNMVSGGATERAVARGVEAAAGQVATQVSTEVVEQITNGVLNNPAVHRELGRQMAPFVGKWLSDMALDALTKFYSEHTYSIWACISIFALIVINVIDYVLTGGTLTAATRQLGFRTMTASARASLRSFRAVAKSLYNMRNTRSPRRQTEMVILFIFLFGGLLAISRPFLGSVVAIAGPYIANRTMGGNNARRINAYVNNTVGPNRQASPRRSPNRQASPRRSPARQASPRRSPARQASPRRVTFFGRSTAANNAARMAARRARFGTSPGRQASPRRANNAARMAARRARFGPAN